MTTWDETEVIVEQAVRHFAVVRTISTPDSYTTEMALRHAMQCGFRELNRAIEEVRRMNAKSAGFSLMSHDLRKAYLALRALEYEDEVCPSDIDTLVLQDAIAAAQVFAEFLLKDFRRIRREHKNA